MHLTRRDFLKSSLGASTLLAFSAMVPGFLCRSAVAAATQRHRRPTALVVIQLSGGNDGLNTVVPYEDDCYHRARPTLRIPPHKVLKLAEGVGMHPEMKAFHRLCRDGLAGIVQGVGYANSNRDHGGAMRDWHTAAPKDATMQTGWIGRALDAAGDAQDASVPGVFVGHIRPPFSLQGERFVAPRIQPGEPWSLAPDADAAAQARRGLAAAARMTGPEPANPLLDFVRRATTEACAHGERVETLTRTLATPGEYPQFRLAQTLRTIAQLVRADVGIRIYFAEMGGGGIGGFDTHAGQAANHGALLRERSESIAAFVNDLHRDKLAERVLVMTFSEFGRTLTENGRHGTNHGAAAPVLLAGGALRGGLVGTPPSLTDLDGDAPKFHTDYRRLYATVLERWLGFDSQAVLGGRFAPLEGVVA